MPCVKHGLQRTGLLVRTAQQDRCDQRATIFQTVGQSTLPSHGRCSPLLVVHELFTKPPCVFSNNLLRSPNYGQAAMGHEELETARLEQGRPAAISHQSKKTKDAFSTHPSPLGQSAREMAFSMSSCIKQSLVSIWTSGVSDSRRWVRAAWSAWSVLGTTLASLGGGFGVGHSRPFYMRAQCLHEIICCRWTYFLP